MSRETLTNNRIVIVPNSELAEYGDELKIVGSDKFFYKEFKEHDMEVFICALVNRKDKNFGWNIRSENHIFGIKQNLIFGDGESRSKKVINYIYTFFKALKVIKNHSFFYLFIPGNVSLIYALVLFLLNKRFGLYIRGDFTRTRFHLIYNFIIRKSSFAIVTCNYVKEQVKPLNENISRVVPMIITSSKDLQEDRSFPVGRPIKYLFVGRPSKEKGIEEIIKAINLLKRDGLNFELEIVGDYDKAANNLLRETIKESGLENHINFSGFTNNPEELKNIFERSDVFVLPSHHEGFPRVVYEAMTFGLPMVLTSLPSYKYTLDNNVHCEIVEVRNSHSLYEGMKTLATDAKKYTLYSKNGLKLMKNYYQVFEEKKSHTVQVLKEINK